MQLWRTRRIISRSYHGTSNYPTRTPIISHYRCRRLFTLDMAGFIQNIIWSSVEGFVEAGKRSAGEYAGNALIRAGDAIENGGRGVGNSTSKIHHLPNLSLIQAPLSHLSSSSIF